MIQLSSETGPTRTRWWCDFGVVNAFIKTSNGCHGNDIRLSRTCHQGLWMTDDQDLREDEEENEEPEPVGRFWKKLELDRSEDVWNCLQWRTCWIPHDCTGSTCFEELLLALEESLCCKRMSPEAEMCQAGNKSSSQMKSDIMNYEISWITSCVLDFAFPPKIIKNILKHCEHGYLQDSKTMVSYSLQ